MPVITGLHVSVPLIKQKRKLQTLWRSSFLARRPSSSAEVSGLVIHDIKEVSVRQQEEQGDKRDEEIGDEVNGEVEEVTHRAHET